MNKAKCDFEEMKLLTPGIQIMRLWLWRKAMHTQFNEAWEYSEIQLKEIKEFKKQSRGPNWGPSLSVLKFVKLNLISYEFIIKSKWIKHAYMLQCLLHNFG